MNFTHSSRFSTIHGRGHFGRSQLYRGFKAMYINRLLLLFAGVLLIFFPAIETWMFSSETAWYRPYQLWLLVIIAAYWNQRSRYPDEL